MKPPPGPRALFPREALTLTRSFLLWLSARDSDGAEEDVALTSCSATGKWAHLCSPERARASTPTLGERSGFVSDGFYWPERGVARQGHPYRHVDLEPSRLNHEKGKSGLLPLPKPLTIPITTAINSIFWFRWVSLERKGSLRVCLRVQRSGLAAVCHGHKSGGL